MQAKQSEEVERFILEKVRGVGILPSQLYADARSELSHVTEQDLRRKIWTLVSCGTIELTGPMQLRHQPDAGE